MLDGADVDNIDNKYENMSKRQIVEVIASAVETALEANVARVKDEVSQSTSDSDKKIADIEKVLMAIVGNLGQSEVRSKHVDYDSYQADIAKIMGGQPGLGFEDAYYIAKSRRTEGIPPSNQTDTEKPGDTVGVLPGGPGAVIPNQSALQTMADRGTASREGSVKSGIVAFRDMVNAAADKIVDGKGSK